MSLIEQKAHVRSLIQAEHTEEARQLLLAMYAQDTNDAEIWHLLATVTGMLGLFEDSIQWSRRVIGKLPHLADAWMNLATALQKSGNPESALDACRHVLRLQPGNVRAQLAAADLCRRLGNREAALKHYRAAIELRPGSPQLHYNLGTFLQETGDYLLAEKYYLKALELNPGLIQARNNLGLIYQEQCRFDDAMRCFNEALAGSDGRVDTDREDSPVAEVHRHRALLLLLLGDFEQGWPEYEWRHTDPTAARHLSSLPLWTGASLTEKSIRISAEQGIGDEIMFASCIPDLQRRAGQVILECSARLIPLFRRSFPGALVIGSDTPEPEGLPAADVQIPAGSLPRYLRRSLEEFPGRAFLHPDPAQSGLWRDRYAKLGDGMKIGIAWRGGGTDRTRRKRSTQLQQWLPVFELAGLQFVNLQYGDCSTELRQLQEQTGVVVHDWPDADQLKDLDQFAAQISALDLVISVDNATVHMAGALGVPVWILQTFSPEWRWLLAREDSYWYPGVRQFRQPSMGEWRAVFDRLAVALSKIRHDRVHGGPE